MKWLSKTALLTLVVATLSGCENLNFEEDKPATDTPEWPTATGQGTRWSPLTVEDVQDGAIPTTDCWVIGYAVGSTYQSMKSANFTASTTYNTNLLLSSDSLANDVEACIPIQLSSTKMQKALSLAHHPEMHRQAVLVHGTYGQYFHSPALREISEGTWLPGFDISSIHSGPQPWEQIDTIP